MTIIKHIYSDWPWNNFQIFRQCFIKFLNWNIDLAILITVWRSFLNKNPGLIKVRSVKRVLDKGTTTLFSSPNLVA